MLGVAGTRTKHGHSARENAPAFSGQAASHCICRQRMAPQVGLEPTTLRLTAGCSAIELLRSVCALRQRVKFIVAAGAQRVKGKWQSIEVKLLACAMSSVAL